MREEEEVRGGAEVKIRGIKKEQCKEKVTTGGGGNEEGRGGGR